VLLPYCQQLDFYTYIIGYDTNTSKPPIIQYCTVLLRGTNSLQAVKKGVNDLDFGGDASVPFLSVNRVEIPQNKRPNLSKREVGE
jgi:hypothetical protein